MPEAAVEEHRDRGPREGNVRTSGRWAIVDTKAESTPMQLTPDSQFQLCVAAADLAHRVRHDRTRRQRVPFAHVAPPCLPLYLARVERKSSNESDSNELLFERVSNTRPVHVLPCAS